MPPSKAVNGPRGTVQGTSSQSVATYTVRAIPLPESITTFLQANQSIIIRLENQSQHESHSHDKLDVPVANGSITEADDDATDEIAISHGELLQKPTVLLEDFWATFVDICKKAGGEWPKFASRVWAFGPNRIGPNLLIDGRSENERW